MNHTRRRSVIRGESFRAAILLVVAACASAPAVAPRTQVRLEPLPVRSAESAAPLPGLSSLSGDAGGAARTEARVTLFSAVNQDVSVVVRELAAKFGLQYQIDPAVRGTVNTTLRNKTLSEALTAIMPQGVTYQVQDGVLRIAPARMSTRIFSLDYVALSRFGSASTIIQRRLGASALGG